MENFIIYIEWIQSYFIRVLIQYICSIMITQMDINKATTKEIVGLDNVTKHVG